MYTKLKLCHISGKIWVIFISFSISVFSDIELSVHVSRHAVLIFYVLCSYTSFLLMQHSKPELPLRTAQHPQRRSTYTHRPPQASDVSTVSLTVKFPYVPTLPPKESECLFSKHWLLLHSTGTFPDVLHRKINKVCLNLCYT